MTRHFLRRVCRALIGIVLFAQLAVSAYACPRLAPAASMQMGATAAIDDKSSDSTTAMTDQQPTDCAGMAGSMDPSFRRSLVRAQVGEPRNAGPRTKVRGFLLFWTTQIQRRF